MKKLNLKSDAFNQGEVLTRAELKKVMGGGEAISDIDNEEPGTCTCPNGTEHTCKHCSVSEGKIYCNGKETKTC